MKLFSFIKNKFKNKDVIKKDESLKKYNKGLAKSRIEFSDKLASLEKKYSKVNDEYFEELEQILIEADCGVSFTLSIIEELLQQSLKENIKDAKLLNESLIDKMFYNYLKSGDDIQNDLTFINKPEVLLVVGVNGVGKTTSIAKIAHRYLEMDKKVLLVAGDTFRAGAVEQLEIWSKRLNCGFVKGVINEDPSSVAYKGINIGIQNNYDLIIIDTAGRLQNKQNLMNELSKIKRVILKRVDTLTCFLVLDATTGQNGVSQAKAFKDLIDIDGIIISKMDGTSKGGIILAIRNELEIPVRFIGLGEGIDDLEEFDLDKYLYGLCRGLIE